MQLCKFYLMPADTLLFTKDMPVPHEGHYVDYAPEGAATTRYRIGAVVWSIEYIGPEAPSPPEPYYPGPGHCRVEIRVEVEEADTLYYAYQLSEATDDTEYAALSSAQKNTYALFISMGHFDLSAGTSIHTKLWAMFPDGTTTRANLVALVG